MAHEIERRGDCAEGSVPDGDIHRDLERAASEVEPPLTTDEYDVLGEHHPQTAISRFSVWTKAKERAGVE